MSSNKTFKEHTESCEQELTEEEEALKAISIGEAMFDLLKKAKDSDEERTLQRHKEYEGI